MKPIMYYAMYSYEEIREDGVLVRARFSRGKVALKNGRSNVIISQSEDMRITVIVQADISESVDFLARVVKYCLPEMKRLKKYGMPSDYIDLLPSEVGQLRG